MARIYEEQEKAKSAVTEVKFREAISAKAIVLE